MKRTIHKILSMILVLVTSCLTVSKSQILMTEEEYHELVRNTPEPGNSGKVGTYPEGSVVSRYGKLEVRGTQLCDEKGNPVILNGLFLRALKKESKFLNPECFDTLANQWNIDVIRIPFMSDSWYSEPSYIHDAHYEQLIDKAVALSEQYGIYCIIDWHVLGDGNPFLHASESRDFFQRMAWKYGAKKHVIYEICNEPNGNEVTWSGVIKPYAELIIPVIRAGDPRALVIVGTSTWSQDVDLSAKDPLEFGNILYAFHFYAGSHKEPLRKKVEAASVRIPLFSSEWGNSTYDATGGPFIEESQKWLDLMAVLKISWCHYALTDFYEDAALLRPGASVNGRWTERELTPSGQFMYRYFRERNRQDAGKPGTDG